MFKARKGKKPVMLSDWQKEDLNSVVSFPHVVEMGGKMRLWGYYLLAMSIRSGCLRGVAFTNAHANQLIFKTSFDSKRIKYTRKLQEEANRVTHFSILCLCLQPLQEPWIFIFPCIVHKYKVIDSGVLTLKFSCFLKKSFSGENFFLYRLIWQMEPLILNGNYSEIS